MSNIDKDDNAYLTIGEAAKKLGLIDKKTGSLQTHTIRYWESQFKQIKPTVKAGKRRYYSVEDIRVLNFIKVLLKEKGLTILGVKKILNSQNPMSIDDPLNFSVYKPVSKTTNVIKNKIKNISKIIKELKKIKDG